MPIEDDLESFLESTIEQLEKDSAFVSEIGTAGGHARLFIGLFLEQENIGIEISTDLQRRCGNLGISLGFDIFGAEERGGAV